MIELQTNSYAEFLQADLTPSKRQKHVGLESVFREVFPIESYDGKVVLDYDTYEIGEPKIDWLECLREGLTYGAPLYVTFLLRTKARARRKKKFSWASSR
jgi:DNA-directed RNA polymerase subunit beta